MSIATIRQGIVDKLSAVTGVTNVLDYIVWTDDWNVIYEKFCDDSERVNVWMIGLGASPLAKLGNSYRERPYTFNIVGYYSIKTSLETSKTFENTIGNIIDAFDGTRSVVAGSEIVQPIALSSMSNTLFAQHPAHTAVMSLTINNRAEVSSPCSG